MRADGERIAMLRGRLGWDQQKLAEESGVSRDTISKLENGMRRRPQPLTIMKLSRALGVDLCDLTCEPRGGAQSTAGTGRPREAAVAPGGLEPAETKRVALYHVCEALDGLDLTILLQMAARMLYSELATGRVSEERFGVGTRSSAGAPLPTGDAPIQRTRAYMYYEE